jgi:hypothetical protein
MEVRYPWTVQSDDPIFIPTGASSYRPKPKTVEQIATVLRENAGRYITDIDRKQPEFSAILGAN